MAKKKILVKDVLGLIEPNTKVCACFNAYGVNTGANSANEGMKTAADCLAQLNYDCLNALVFRIDIQEKCVPNQINIFAELVH